MSENSKANEKTSRSGKNKIKVGLLKTTPALVPPVLRDVSKLAVGVASVSTSSGSATGNPRNKIALQPGHSLMDWIRLGTSGKDLTGLGTRAGTLTVTKQELARHNKQTDAWLAIRGRVYCITEYLPFHPGGEEELMRGAGVDATSLFEQVHPWVNYEQILQKCYVGKLVSIDPSVDTEALFFGEKNEADNAKKHSGTKLRVSPANSLESPAENNVKSIIEDELDLPRFDWIQKLDYITIIFYTKPFCNPLIEIQKPPNEKTVLMYLTCHNSIFKNELTFFDGVCWPCQANVLVETGKVELVFRKCKGGIWENYGVLKQQAKLMDSSSISLVRSNYIIKKKFSVNYNTTLLKLEREDNTKIVVPVGQHVRVFGTVDGEEISRSYTPVPDNLFDNFLPQRKKNDNVCLMLKRYPKGKMSRYVTDKDVGDEPLVLSRPFGGFDLRAVEKRETFLMLAAGTGITPMLGFILFLLERRIKKCQFIRLLFFNRTEKDILFRKQLEELSSIDRRFKMNNILSEPDESWHGDTGHITPELIRNSLQEHLQDTGYTIRDIFSLVCGPPKFNVATLQALQDVSIAADQIIKFEG